AHICRSGRPPDPSDSSLRRARRDEVLSMRISLRWKILILTVLAPVALAIGTLWTVNVAVSRHQKDSIDESLRRSSNVFENMMAERARPLEVPARVIGRAPRLFSTVTRPR